MSNHSYKLAEEETVSAVTATPSVSLGTQRIESGNIYIYGYNGGAVQASVGSPVIVQTTATNCTFMVTCASQVTYDSAGSAADSQFETLFGVVQHTTVAAGSYGWVLIKGFCDVKVTSHAVIAQDRLVIADLGGSAVVQTFTSHQTTNLEQIFVGRALSVATAAADGRVGIYLS